MIPEKGRTMDNQNTPRPSTEGPRMSASNGELYAQITAEDEEVVITPTAKPTHVVSIMAVLMKITFHIDAFRRSNERLFIFLHSVWATLMGGLYLSGIVTLLLSIFSFTQLPIYMEKYFNDHGIQYDSLEMSDYSFSKINVTNLKDINNTYTIPNVTVHSTFADFLQKRIRMIEAGGLRINLNNNTNESIQGIKLLFDLLQSFAAPEKTGLDLAINTVRISNAVLNVQSSEKTIPVTFSLSGTYMSENQVIVPFSINENFLKMDASLEITGPQDAQKIEIKTISSGEITLPRHPTEKINGKIIIQMQDNTVQSIEAEIYMLHASSLKTIRANLKNNGQNSFDGNVLFTIGTSADGKTSSDLSTDITIGFTNLNLTSEGMLLTQDPLSVSIRRLTYFPTLIEGLETQLKGNLTCDIKKQKCDYVLKEQANVKMQKLDFFIQNEPVSFSQPSFILNAPDKKIITLQMNNPYFQFDSPVNNVKLNGQIGVNRENLMLNTQEANLIFVLGQTPKDNHLQVSVKKGSYLASNLSMDPFDLFVQDYFNPTAKIQLTSDEVKITSSLIQKPFSLDILNIGEQTSIKGNVLETPITFNAKGRLDPFRSAFSGTFIIPPFNLDEIPFKLSDLSTAFSPKISQLSGQFTAYGQLHLFGFNNISGPFAIGLKDASAHLDNIPLLGINGVLTLNSLTPLTISNNQKLFIQDVQTFVPISNLSFQFQIENQSLRLSNLTGQIAGQDVMMSSSLIPLKNTNEILSLRTAGTFDLETLNPYFDLKGIYIKNGKGSFNIPVFVSDNGINLNDLTFKISNSTWEKTEDSDAFNLFDNGTNEYTVRSGQLILNPQNELEYSLDGWFLPNNTKASFGPNTIQLENPLLKSGEPTGVPQEIQNLQNQLFNIGTIE